MSPRRGAGCDPCRPRRGARVQVLGLRLRGEAEEGVYLSCSFLSRRLGGVFSRINLRPPRVASFQGSRLGAVGAPVGGDRASAGQRGSQRRRRGGAGDRGGCVRRRCRLRKDEGLRSPWRSCESEAPCAPAPLAAAPRSSSEARAG